MLRRLFELQDALRHYVRGSAHLIVHLALYERRARACLPEDTSEPLDRAKPISRKADAHEMRPGPVKARPRRAERSRSAGSAA